MKLSDFRKAQARLSPYLPPTPLLNSLELDEICGLGQPIYLKCENLQVTGSFKVRGALHAMLANYRPKVITRSSGNFAQAIAWAGHILNAEVIVIMPTNASALKKKRTLHWGAQVISHGITYDEGYAKACELVRDDPSFVFLSPFDDLDVIAGQGSLALEVLQQCPNLSHFLCPIGGGGLMSGCASVLKMTQPSICTIGLEPAGAPDYRDSRQRGERSSLAQPADTIADGLRTTSVGLGNWPLLETYVDEAEVVCDSSIKRAMKLLFDTVGLVVEPSAAVSLAYLLENPELKAEGPIVCVLSGRNVDRQKYMDYLGEAALVETMAGSVTKK